VPTAQIFAYADAVPFWLIVGPVGPERSDTAGPAAWWAADGDVRDRVFGMVTSEPACVTFSHVYRAEHLSKITVAATGPD